MKNNEDKKVINLKNTERAAQLGCTNHITPPKKVNALINEELSSFHSASPTYHKQENIHELIIVMDTRPQHFTCGGAHAAPLNAALLSR